MYVETIKIKNKRKKCFAKFFFTEGFPNEKNLFLLQRSYGTNVAILPSDHIFYGH
jgi:hypothetical protein